MRRLPTSSPALKKGLMAVQQVHQVVATSRPRPVICRRQGLVDVLSIGDSLLETSVIICAHNPRSEYFARVLDSLRNQTLSPNRWELLIIDNASKVPLASAWDISWHPRAHHFMENELGISAARRRGIREASADLIVFVDDDNVLDKRYLSEALRIKQEWPLLGAWGSGSIRADFEVEPPEHRGRFLSWLPLRESKGARWGNDASCLEATPWGAGLCVRKAVARGYGECSERSSIQITGRRGNALLSGEDREFSFVCCAQGLGIGVFPNLKITHLIPCHRVTDDYMVRLVEGITLSNLLIDYKWQGIIPQSPLHLKVLLSVLKAILLHRGFDRRMRFALVRALVKAKRIIQADLRYKSSQTAAMCRGR